MKLTVIIIMVISLVALLSNPAIAAIAKWSGVDESVVEKFAEEHGRTAVDPVINTDKGDLLLFVFLMGGTVAGFIGGYYWRVLNEPRTPETDGEKETGKA